MKPQRHLKAFVSLALAVLAAVSAWTVLNNAPLFLNARLDRIWESNLPSVTIENETIVYCRMKADDFRFPLPPGSVAADPVLDSGGFDTVSGTLEVRYLDAVGMSAKEYEQWLSKQLQAGGRVTVTDGPIARGMTVSFHYFGDK